MSSGFDWLKYFKAKAWALLHDPPNKMWVIMGKGRCLHEQYLRTGAHEDEAAAIWYKLGLTDPLGDMHDVNDPAYRLVKHADAVASSMDRWLLGEAVSQGGVFRYSKLHNIFNPSYSIELPNNVDCGAVSRHVETLRSVMNSLSNFNDNVEKARVKYHALYALYELTWINEGLPPSLADTRMPTHTVFDHSYATALTINMLWSDGEVNGYLVEVDIPGIQRIVNSARKAGDFWVGSWLVSMLAWLTVWPLVWEYGPDLVIRPTLRLNPIYHATLIGALSTTLPRTLERDNIIDTIKNITSRFYLKTMINIDVKETDITQQFIREPIIPGTMTLIMPSIAASDEGKVVEILSGNFERAYNCLLNLAFNGEVNDKYCTDVLPRKIDDGGDTLLKISRKLYSMLNKSGVFKDLISVRINAVNLHDVYECLLSHIRGASDKCLIGGVELTGDDLKMFSEDRSSKLRLPRELRETLREKGVEVSDEELAKFLIMHMGLRILNKVAQVRARKRLTVGKAWFHYNDSTIKKPITADNVDAYSEYVFKKANREDVGFIYCSICGEEPAIVHLRKAPGGLNYADDTIDMLKKSLELTTDDEIGNLRFRVKPGEALGPLCLLKRTLYYRLKRGRYTSFDSTEDVAFAWYDMRISGYVVSKLPNSDEHRECRNVKDYIVGEPPKDITKICGLECTLEVARRLFNSCIDKASISHDDKVKLINELSRDLDIDDSLRALIKGVDDSLLKFRSYYAIIKGDADNIGELSKGDIPLDGYYKLLTELSKVAENAGARELSDAYAKLSSVMHGLGGLIVSPTYLATLSMALMITALRDIYITEYKYAVKGLIFSGGDDVLALTPVETSLTTVRDMRRNYWGDGGFHRIGDGYHIAAPVIGGFGRSFSVRFVNIMDNMNEEVKETIELLEGISKKAEWSLNQVRLKKDTLTISESRTGMRAVIPLSDGKQGSVANMIDALNQLFIARLGKVLSGNLPEDFDEYLQLINQLVVSNRGDVLNDVWGLIIRRNAESREYESKVAELFSLSNLANITGIDAAARLEIKASPSGSYLINELVKAYRVLRGYP